MARKRVLISQRAYARHRGIAHTSVQEAIRNGRITTVSGKIDPNTADREWEQNTDQSKPRNDVIGDPRQRRDPDKPNKPMDLDSAREQPQSKKRSATSGYAEARALREVYDAQLSKLRLEREQGKLVSAEEVARAARGTAQRTKEQLIALPDRLAVSLAAAQDQEEVRRILEEEIDRLCQELSNAERY